MRHLTIKKYTQFFKDHVLLVVQNNSFPTDKRVAKEALTLKMAGFNVSVISPANGQDRLKKENWQGVEVYRYRHFESQGGLVGFILEYTKALTSIFWISFVLFLRKPFKLIHVANPPDFFWPMAILFKLFGVKFIFDQHDISAEMYRVNEQKGKNIIYNILNYNEKITIRCANGVITTNTSIRNRIETLYGLHGKPCEVVYNGPSADFDARASSALENKYADKKVLLYVGEMATVDCVEVLIEAMEKIVKDYKYNNVVLVLLGDGPTRCQLEILVKEKNLENFIEFKGMVSHEEVMNYLGIAAVGLVPDEPNGLNEYLTLIKSLEYMKAGLPFVAFELKETIFIAGESALFAKNFLEYVQNILYLLDNPSYRQLLGKKGKQRIESKFLWEHQEPKLLSLYDRVLNKHRKCIQHIS